MKQFEAMKKDLQKVIKAVRDENDLGTYPKAIMTISQMEKRTATVNCGGEFAQWDKERAEGRAQAVMSDERFVAFLKKHNATAHTELDKFGVTQIRINY